MSKNGIGYVGIDKDYFVSVKEVLDITAETGALETQERVRDLPHADVVEVRHGEWKSVKASIYPYGYDVECSVCGHKMGSSFGYKYCPNCGAKMDGEEQEHE